MAQSGVDDGSTPVTSKINFQDFESPTRRTVFVRMDPEDGSGFSMIPIVFQPLEAYLVMCFAEHFSRDLRRYCVRGSRKVCSRKTE